MSGAGPLAPKKCPFCGEVPVPYYPTDLVRCAGCSIPARGFWTIEHWNTRRAPQEAGEARAEETEQDLRRQLAEHETGVCRDAREHGLDEAAEILNDRAAEIAPLVGQSEAATAVFEEVNRLAAAIRAEKEKK